MCNTMTIRYETRNGKRYAYKCTSKRMPDKPYPVSQKEYLGVVDENTGSIIPKKVSSDEQKFMLKDKGFSVKDYGNVITVAKVADDLHIGEDLSNSFGSSSLAMKAMAMAQAMNPAALMDTQITMDSSFIRETVGLRDMEFPSQRISEMVRIIGEATGCMDDLFTLRAKRSSDGTFLYDITSQSTYSEMNGWAEFGHNRDGEKLKQMNIGLVTDREGIPVAFDMFPGSISDTTTLKRFSDDMKRRCPGCVLVMDRGFENAGNVMQLIDNGTEFIMPCNINTKTMKTLLTDFSSDVTRPEYDKRHNGHVYSVKEHTLGIVKDDEGCRYISDVDEGFEGSVKVKAFVCFDSKKRSDDEQELKNALIDKINELDGKRFRDPAKQFADAAGWMSKYLEYEMKDDGTIHVVHKTNAMAFFRNRAGMFIMISSSDIDWETVMTSYDARDNVEKAFDVYKNELDGKRGRTGDPIRARGRFFIKFIALMIRVRMQNIISKAKIRELTVENALMTLGTYKIIDSGDRYVRTERSKKVREIFGLFGVEDPEEISYPASKK